jgi:hypothetical protein
MVKSPVQPSLEDPSQLIRNGLRAPFLMRLEAVSYRRRAVCVSDGIRSTQSGSSFANSDLQTHKTNGTSLCSCFQITVLCSTTSLMRFQTRNLACLSAAVFHPHCNIIVVYAAVQHHGTLMECSVKPSREIPPQSSARRCHDGA